MFNPKWDYCKIFASYSPQFNPIENVFGYIKFKCNNFRPKAKTQEELLCHIDRAIAEFNQLEQGWANFLARGPHLNVELICGPHYNDL